MNSIQAQSTLCDYERKVLSRICFGDFPDDPGAAWWAASEALSTRGLISEGEITKRGRASLLNSTIREPKCD